MDKDQYAPLNNASAINNFDFDVVTALCTDDGLRRFVLTWPGYASWRTSALFDFSKMTRLFEPHIGYKASLNFARSVDMNSLYMLARDLDDTARAAGG